MSHEADILVKLLDLENNRVIHYQKERTYATNTIFVVTGAIFALITYDKDISGYLDIFLALILTTLGFLGMLLNAKYHERIYKHEKRISGFYAELDRQLPNARIKNVLTEINITTTGATLDQPPKPLEKESKLDRFLFRRTLWRTWFMVNVGTFVIGLVLEVVAIVQTL